MIYLISKVVIWLALAFVLGALLGWWLRRFKAMEAQAVYSAELDKLTSENTRLSADKQALTQELAQKVQTLAATENTLEAKEQEVLAQTNELLQVQRQLSEAQVRIAEQEEEATQLAGQLELQRSSLAEVQAQAETLASDQQQAASQWALDRSVLEDKLAIADKDLAAITLSAGEQRNRLQNELTQAQSGANQGAKKLQAKVEGLQQQHLLLQQQHTDQIEQAQSLDKSNSRLSTKVANLLEELAALQSSTDERDTQLRAQVDSLQQSLAQTRDLAEERQRELDANNESLSSNESQVQRLTQDVRRWRQRIPDLQGELDEKEALLRERDSRLATLQEQLDNRVARLQASQRALIGKNEHSVPQQQKDARIAQLMATVERLGKSQVSVAPPPAVAVPAVVPAAPQAIASTEAGAPARPQGFFATRPSQVDDLQRIKGIGPKLEGLLHELGIYQFQQIAKLSRSDVAWLDDYLNFKGRIDRDNWIAQAGELAAQG